MLGRRILAVISCIVLSMAIAYPWHLMWFHDAYQAMGAVTRPEPNVPLGMVAMLMQGLVTGVALGAIFGRLEPVTAREAVQDGI